MDPEQNGGESNHVPFSIAIVGGGIGGLVLAVALHRNTSIPIMIYEAASKFGEIGAGVAFGPNAMRAFERISPALREGFERRATIKKREGTEDVWFNHTIGMSGTVAAEKGFKSALGDPNANVKEGDFIYTSRQREPRGGQIHRAAFLDEMVKLFPNDIAVFGKRLASLTDHGTGKGVTLTFTDGTAAHHSAVVGCDGIKSRVRQLLLGPSNPASHAVFTGKYCYRGLIPMDDAVSLLGERHARENQNYSGYGGHVLTFPVEKGRSMNVVAFTSAKSWPHDNWVVKATKEQMYADFDGWSSHVRSIMKLMTKPDTWALFNHLPADTYTQGRVCILGDAAHASTPHQGSGAAMAVEDACVISGILGQVKEERELEAAFKAYDTLRRPRSQRLVEDSRVNGLLYDLELEGVGDNLEQLAHELHVRRDWIWNKDIGEDVEEGKKMFAEMVHSES